MGAGITISAAIEAMEKGKSYRLVQRGGAVEAPLEQQKRVIIPAAVDGSEIPNNHLGCINPRKQWG